MWAKYLFQKICQSILFRGRFSGCSLVFGVCSNPAIGIKSANDTVGFLEDLTSFFKKGFDGVNEFLFV